MTENMFNERWDLIAQPYKGWSESKFPIINQKEWTDIPHSLIDSHIFTTRPKNENEKPGKH